MLLIQPSSVAVAAVCTVVVYLLQRAVLAVLKFRRYELAIPGPPSLPILGSTLSILFTTKEDVMERLADLRGGRRDMSCVSFMNHLFVFVSKPEDVAAVMKRKDLADKPHYYYDFFAQAAPSNITTLNGAKWKMHRIASAPAFLPEIIDSFVDVFAEEAEKFAASVEPYKDLLIQDQLFSTTMWSFCRSVMMSGTPTKEQEDRANILAQILRNFLEQSNERAFNPLLWSKWVYSKTKEGQQMKKGIQTFKDFCQEIMDARVSELKECNRQEDTTFLKKRKTLLDALLEAHSKDEQAFPKEDILDELMFFLAAATETSVGALNFTYKMLSLRPDIQRKVYEEVSSLLGSGVKKRSVIAQDLPKLEYTERVIKETLRLFATIPIIARHVREDTELCGHKVPKGTTVVINLLDLHRDPVTWPDPLRFDPDRFLPEQSERRHPYAFLPFSAGLRNCIGYRYAWAGMKSVVATTIRDFVVEPADDGLTDHTQFKFLFDVGLKLNGGVRVKLIPRERTVTPV